MIISIEQWITGLVAIAEIIIGGALYKLSGERVALQKERADWHKEKASDWEKQAKDAEKKYQAVFNNEQDKEKTIKAQETKIQNAAFIIMKLMEDLTKMKTAQILKEMEISGATAYSSPGLAGLVGLEKMAGNK